MAEAENPPISELKNYEKCIKNANECKEGKLPSTVTETEKLYIFFPEDKSKFDPQIYGKWIWFNSGGLDRQDEIWIKLKPFVDTEYVLLLESSTTQNWGKGIIQCYTSKDREHILKAGLALQSIVGEKTILFYKTAEASKLQQTLRLSYRFITKYMLTVNGKLCERDALDRWKMIAGGEEHKTIPREPYLPRRKRDHYSECGMVPSEEKDKFRYVLRTPRFTSILEPAGIWHLFCDITDLDSNCLTELDRMWIKAKTLFDEGLFEGVSTETNAYFQKGDVNFHRRTVTFYVKDYRDVANVMKTGRVLLKRTNYPFHMYLKSVRVEGDETKFDLRYLLTEDGELYAYTDEQWSLLQVVSEIE